MAQTLPGTGLANIEPNAPNQSTPANELFAVLDAAFGALRVIDRGLTAPPGSESDGDLYIPAATATGTWATHEDDFALYFNAAYIFIAPLEGMMAYIVDENVYTYWNGSAWTDTIPMSVASSPVGLVWSDETTSFTAASGTAEAYTIDATSGDVTATLPAAASNDGVVFYFKRIDSSGNSVTVDGNASETIDGELTRTLASQYDQLTVACDGTDWHII